MDIASVKDLGGILTPYPCVGAGALSYSSGKRRCVVGGLSGRSHNKLTTVRACMHSR
jgi:hypothetical protein